MADTSLPRSGMITDLNALNMQGTQYPYGLNGTVNSNDQEGNSLSVQNEESNHLAVNFPANYKVNGKLPIYEQGRTIFFLVRPETGESQIGEVINCQFNDDTDDELSSQSCDTCEYPYERIPIPLEERPETPFCSYRTITSGICLGFNINFPVRSEYKINDCGLNIYFTDNKNQRRHLSFVYNQQNQLVLDNKYKVITGYTTGDCAEPIYSDAIDCNKINYHPTLGSPCLELEDVISGGSLRAGVYQFIPYFSDAEGNPLGNPLPTNHPIPIYSREITFETNYTTDRAIALKFTNIAKEVYDYYTVIVAQTVDNFTEFKEVGTFSTLKERFVYTGNEENLKKLTSNDVFYRNPFYNTAANITSANNYLFFSELSEFPKPNLQRAANRVKLNWQTAAIPEAVYKDPKNTYFFKSFMRDEVYPLGMMFITENGEELGPYHIPGPSKTDFQQYSINVDQVITNSDVVDRGSCLEADPNCCGDENPNSLAGTFTVSCNDNNCTSQGETILNFNFAQPTPTDLTLHVGNIYRNNNGSIKYAQGYELYSIPSGVQQDTYHYGCGSTNQSSRPYIVTIPAGSTSYSVTHIQIKDPVVGCDYAANFDNSRWVCQSCLSGIMEVFVKTITPGYQLNLTTTQTVRTQNPQQFPSAPSVPLQIHNIPSESLPQDPDCIDCSESLDNTRWRVYNTGFVIGTPHEHFINCDNDTIWEWGQFAYWESSERYPNNQEKWGELCGKPIRHHKFPDSLVTHIHDGLNSDKQFGDNNIVFPIGILVNHQSVIDALNYCVTNNLISPSDRARIKEYRIIRGNRVGNESVVAKGLLFDMWNYSKDNNTYYYPNYPYNDLRPDNFIAPTRNYGTSTTSNPIPNTFNKTSRYTFHSPNVHFTNKKIGTELKLETLEYGKSEGYFNQAEEQARYRFLSTFAATLAFGAGLAAAFSVEKEKECKQITIKSERHIEMQELPTALGSGGGTIPIPIPGAVQGDIQLFTAGASWGYDELLNIASPLKPNPLASEVTYNTCKGRPLQLLSITSGNPAGILTGGVMQIPYLLIIGMREMNIIIDLIKALLPKKNLSIQYNSIGKYNNYKNIANSGNKIRQINRSAYLEPFIQSVNEALNAQANQFSTISINNHNRERSVYLKLDNAKPLPNPAIQDDSRFTMDQAGLGYDDLNTRVYRNISSYYSSIKNYVPDQYGRIGDIEYLELDSCSFKLSENYPIEQLTRFGGDTFINRFALKRKMPFFLQTRFKFEDESDVRYSELGNVGYPNYYFNTEEPYLERFSDFSFSLTNLGSFYQRLIGVARTRLDAKTSKAFYQNGYIHLYNYGIPYFFTESDVNVDYRHGQNNLEKDFFPHQGDLNFWLQEKNVPITEDNYYFYNTTYSKQNKENVIGIEPDTNDRTKECRIDHSSRIIVSDQGNNDSLVDEWLRFRGNNFKDFPTQKGAIISIDGIENDKVLVRFENSSQIFGAYQTLQTDSGDIAVGNAGLFQSPPREFANTKLGYAGSQHSAILQTEFGHIFVDAKRGQVFLLSPNAQSLDELTKDGTRNWFRENLPFQIQKDFPKFSLQDLNNNFKGIGLDLSFDKRFSRFFLTKLDYKKIDNSVVYDPLTKAFIKNNQPVQLSDSRYFLNRSWTISYSFLTKSWVFFHSFTPNYYIEGLETFQTGYNSTPSKLYSHNVSNKSYQVYNGKLYPFILETISDPALQNTTLQAIEFETEALRYHNLYDYAHAPEITFNKAIVYNDTQCSGLLSLIVRDEDDIFGALQYPRVENNEQQIMLTNKEGKWRFNQFYDTVNSPRLNVPFFLNSPNNANKELNLKALNYYKPDIQQPLIRGKQCKVRLINDKHSNYKLIYHFINHQRNSSIF